MAGVSLWEHSDPGGPYVVSALEFFDSGRRLPFVGHPGVPLQLSIGVPLKIAYGVSRLGGGEESYSLFWARRVSFLFMGVGLLMALWHCVSFHVIFAVGRDLFASPRAGLLAAVGYATSFPTLHYSTRASVEPLLVSAFLGTFLALWQVQRALDRANLHRAVGFAALAGALSTIAASTKLHHAALLIPFGLVQVLLQGTGSALARTDLRSRCPPAAAYLMTVLGTLSLVTLKVEWGRFFEVWSTFATPGRAARAGQHLANYLNPRTYEGLFTLAEAGYLLVCAVGASCYLRSSSKRFSPVVWPLMYLVLLTPLLVYRPVWHYGFLHLAMASIFFGWLLTRPGRSHPAIPATWALGIVLLLHSVAFGLAISGRVHDSHEFRRHWSAIHQALGQLPPNTRVALVGPAYPPTWAYGELEAWSEPPTPFARAFQGLFFASRDSQQICGDGALGTHISLVVDQTSEPARVLPLARWCLALDSPLVQ